MDIRGRTGRAVGIGERWAAFPRTLSALLCSTADFVHDDHRSIWRALPWRIAHWDVVSTPPRLYARRATFRIAHDAAGPAVEVVLQIIAASSPPCM